MRREMRHEDDMSNGEMPQQQTQQPAGETPGTEQQPEVTFDAWLTEQPDDVRGLITKHTTGLKSALDSERAGRRELEKQIKQLARASEEGSEARRQLDKLASDLTTANHQAAFYDDAHREGARNLRLAWLAAREGGHVDDKGRCDFAALKQSYPELFEQRRSVPGNAGNGARQEPARQDDFNNVIRRAIGRN